jgi:enoyl-CoA hydratase/carnithine racemase
MTDHIKVTKADGVLTLAFDRPDKKNAITDAMYEVLANELEAAETDAQVRTILIRSEGDLFTSGNDVSEFAMAAMSGTGLINVGRFLAALAKATRPIVAAVQGKAVGVGTTLLLHCDHVILADDAQLSTPFVNLALVPEAASTLLLPARIGYARAFTMFALGDPVGPADALAWGLANQVVARADLPETAKALATRLARQPLSAPATVRVKVGLPGKPVASPGSIQVAYQTTGVATLRATGIFDRFAITTEPQHGEVVIDGDKATYTPDALFFGADAFAYTATGPGGH